MSLMSLALEGGFFTTSTNREARMSVIPQFIYLFFFVVNFVIH